MITRILPILILIIAGGIFFGYVNPTYQGSIAESSRRIKSYESALVASKKFAVKEAELTTARAAIPPDGLTRLEAYLPDGVNNVQLILDLNALAARSGLVLSNFSINESNASAAAPTGNALALDSAKPVDSLDISLSATGTYDAFHTFLQGVERGLRQMDIVSLSVGSGTGGTYTYTVAMRIYWLH